MQMDGIFDFRISELGEKKIPSPVKLSSEHGNLISNYVRDDEFIRYNIEADRQRSDKGYRDKNLIEKAGPREKIYFHPSHVHAAICTSGGLCPGMNDVIRSIVLCLWHLYGVRKISGIKFGFKGFLPEYLFDTIPLTPAEVENIHKIGGSFLGSSRGAGNRTIEIADSIERMNINILFIIGGDGTQKASLAIANELEKRKLNISVIAIPKTIDNDFIFIQKSFGFDTAVSKAEEAVASAHMEAISQINGIGLVKLMGRESGFIAVSTVLASHEANFCLIPEIPFDLDGEEGFLMELEKRLLKRHHAVIVVAEGAGQDFFKSAKETDASGNIKLGDIGIFLKSKISEYFQKRDIHINLKYIDPSYQIRAAEAIASDSIYCERLGTNAVHAAMAGKTKMLVGLVHNKYVHLPISLVVAKRNVVNPEESMWLDVIETTGQPELMVNDKEKAISEYKDKKLLEKL